MNEERNTFYDCEADVSLDDMDVSGTDPRGDRDQGGSSSSNKRKKKSDARDNVYSSFDEAATVTPLTRIQHRNRVRGITKTHTLVNVFNRVIKFHQN